MTALRDLIYFKEQFEIKAMGKNLAKSMKKDGKQFFDLWMYEMSDEILSLALAFGERFFLESALEMHDNECKHPGAKRILEKNIDLYMKQLLVDNMGWYLSKNLISTQAAKALVSNLS